MYRNISFLSVILLITMVSSCRKNIDEYYLSSELKAQLPYNSYDTISYLDSYGDTILFIGGNRNNVIFEGDQCNYCDGIIIESENISFSNDSYTLFFNISPRPNGLICYLSFNNHTYRIYHFIPLSKETISESEIYYDSLMVNEKIYTDVFQSTPYFNGEIINEAYPTSFYYSINYGLFKVDFSDSTYWVINR